MECFENENSIWYKIHSFTKYFDICYWRARRNGEEYLGSFEDC
ncbi:MAG: hypothetical protein ACW967_02225 [Candidatus Hodarchaeales archaeon]|jgi:hypothetical protein